MNPFAQNPQATAVRKYLFEILKDRYQKNSDYIDRLAAGVATKKDYESLGALVADIYESGFVRAVDQYRDQISKMGMSVSVVPEQKTERKKSIFGDQSEKSG